MVFQGFSRVFNGFEDFLWFFLVFHGFSGIFRIFQAFSGISEIFHGFPRFFKVFRCFLRFFKGFSGLFHLDESGFVFMQIYVFLIFYASIYDPRTCLSPTITLLAIRNTIA